MEVITLINDGTGLGFGIIGGKSTGVVVKTILPGGVADRVTYGFLLLLLLEQIWNNIPLDMRLCCTLPTFKRHLKTYLFKWHFTLHSRHPPHLATACASDSVCLLTLFALQMFVLLLLLLLLLLFLFALRCISPEG